MVWIVGPSLREGGRVRRIVEEKIGWRRGLRRRKTRGREVCLKMRRFDGVRFA
jgi:hypothetical protein